MTPSLFLLVIVVAYASVSDLTAHRIPNWLCLVALVAGIVMQVHASEPVQLILLSVVVPFLLFIPFYVAGGMAAGDVKLMASCGALLGWPAAGVAAGYTLIFGAVLGIGVYLYRGGWRSVVERYGFATRALFATGKLFLEAAPAGSVAASRFPYAVAIALGCIASVLYPIVR